jgi:hypothetical protein
VRLDPGAEQLLLLFVDNVRLLLVHLARDILPLVALERLGLIKVLKAARAKVLE